MRLLIVSPFDTRTEKTDAAPRKLLAEHVRIDRQGYDRRGSYWGVGQKLYRVSDYETGMDTFVRASDAKSAKEIARADVESKAIQAETGHPRWTPGHY